MSKLEFYPNEKVAFNCPKCGRELQIPIGKLRPGQSFVGECGHRLVFGGLDIIRELEKVVQNHFKD